MRPSYFWAVARRGLLCEGSSVRPVFAVPERSMDNRHRCPPVAGVKAGESFPDRAGCGDAWPRPVFARGGYGARGAQAFACAPQRAGPTFQLTPLTTLWPGVSPAFGSAAAYPASAVFARGFRRRGLAIPFRPFGRGSRAGPRGRLEARDFFRPHGGASDCVGRRPVPRAGGGRWAPACLLAGDASFVRCRPAQKEPPQRKAAAACRWR